ncbi:hypothetical protein Pcinc_034357 [Petrolisthes cinctipes]|uniref:Uncharacterized protein n=1 Tax=Petrolisthes cinctipes TaxID=88211 RepID=A0AAE1JXH7_PETCI|nr:hypothetical protein Pcinc_034357 [Petrolisthes cinctipes]
MADFFQSSLFNPSAPSECILNMLKESKMIRNHKCKSGKKNDTTRDKTTQVSPKSTSLRLLTSRIFIIKNNNSIKKVGKQTGDMSEEEKEEEEESKRRRGKLRLLFTHHQHKVSKQQLDYPKNSKCWENSSPKSQKLEPSQVIRSKLNQQDQEKFSSSSAVTENSDDDKVKKRPRKNVFYQNIFQPKEITTGPSGGKSLEADVGLEANTSTHEKLRHLLRNVFNAKWSTRGRVVEDRQILVEEEEVMGGREEEAWWVHDKQQRKEKVKEVKERKMKKAEKVKERKVKKVQEMKERKAKKVDEEVKERKAKKVHHVGKEEEVVDKRMQKREVVELEEEEKNLQGRKEEGGQKKVEEKEEWRQEERRRVEEEEKEEWRQRKEENMREEEEEEEKEEEDEEKEETVSGTKETSDHQNISSHDNNNTTNNNNNKKKKKRLRTSKTTIIPDTTLTHWVKHQITQQLSTRTPPHPTIPDTTNCPPGHPHTTIIPDTTNCPPGHPHSTIPDATCGRLTTHMYLTSQQAQPSATTLITPKEPPHSNKDTTNPHDTLRPWRTPEIPTQFHHKTKTPPFCPERHGETYSHQQKQNEKRPTPRRLVSEIASISNT